MTPADRGKIPTETEAQLQKSVAEFFALALPPHALAFHIPNEGKRGWQAQRDFKEGGGVAGLPDWEILFTGRAIFIELKIGKKDLSPAQEAIHERIRLCGHVVTTCRSVEAVEAFLRVAGIPLKASVRSFKSGGKRAA